MKQFFRHVLIILLTSGLLAVVVVVSGVVPVKASSGHLAITAWLLKFSMSRSVATYSINISVPDIDKKWMMVKGAGHFHSGCRPCHGAPDLPHPRIAWQMTPHPPELQNSAKRWSPEELFYIIKHGVKFTGMPAWPSQLRDDEVWAMVSFLEVLPELTSDSYKELVHGPLKEQMEGVPIVGLSSDDSKLPDAIIDNCSRCHGLQGEGRGYGAFPRLAGQNAKYLYGSLKAYADGARYSGMMQPIAAALSKGEFVQLSSYYSSRMKTIESSQKSPELIKQGKKIAYEGLPSRKIPSCNDCHGPAEFERNPAYPLLAGQYSEYLYLQLKLFKDERRGGSEYSHLMRPGVHWLEEEEMRAVSEFYQSLSPND